MSPRRIDRTPGEGNYPAGPPPISAPEPERGYVAWTCDLRDGIAHDHDPRVIVATSADEAATLYAASQYGTAADDMRALVRVAPIVGWAA